MDIKNKVLHVNSQFTKELPSTDEEVTDSLYISGYASMSVPDRQGDLVPTTVWQKGMDNYLKNPIILAYHDHSDPCGRMVEHRIDEKGLWIKARISAASEIFNLVKDGVLTAFSVGFRVRDAEYNSNAELFVIKELELIEISIVSVPANQDTLFSLSKSFKDEEEYKLFKLQFSTETESAKGLDPSPEENCSRQKEIGMDPKELQAMLDAAATNAAETATKKLLEVQKAEEDARRKAAEQEELLQKRIKEAVAAVTPSTTGAERLVDELKKRIDEQEKSAKDALEGLQAALKEKAAEIEAMTRSKMAFTDGNTGNVSYEEKEKAILLSKMSGKAIENTKYGQELIVKYGGAPEKPHAASATWETEVSFNMQEEVRRRLVVAPIMRNVAMQTNVMKLPLNPEAGYGTWITNSDFGNSNGNSSGSAATHALSEITLNSYKLATKEYMAYEEEEDSLIVMMPIVRDAMIRRMARSVDKAFLLGTAATGDPITGLAKYDTVSAVTLTATGATAASTSTLRALRKDLGAWGLDPTGVVYIVNTEFYYDLMEDSLFQTMDKVGDRATVLTGQVGMVGGSPVLVSSELPAKTGAANSGGNVTNVGAIAVCPANFIVGNQRGLRVERDTLVEQQRTVLVASLRLGMTRLTTNLGDGVSAFRWV